MKIVRAEVDEMKLDPRSPVPITVQIRLSMEKQGIIFTDSGKLSAIANLNPTPVGKFNMWKRTDTPHVIFIEQHQPN